MKRNMAWVVTVAVAFGAGACSSKPTPVFPLESPVGEIQAAGAPRAVVRIVNDPNYSEWINDIAISGDDLYVAVAWGGVYRLPKFGGGITTVEESTDSRTEFQELAVGDGAVFWEAVSFNGDDFPTNHLRRVIEGGADVATIYQAALGPLGVSAMKNLQVDGAVVYMTEAMNVSDLGAVHRIPTRGGAELPSILPFKLQDAGLYNPTDMPTNWVARNGAVFLAQCPGDGSCAVLRVTGDGTQTIATFPGDEAHVRAADETSLYVTNMFHVPPPPGGIPPIPLLKIDQQTGTVVQLAADGSDGWYMLADDQELFFAAFNTGITINAISKQGGDQRIVADMTESPGILGMAQDDTHLFVVTPGGGNPYESEVIAIPKHPPAP